MVEAVAGGWLHFVDLVQLVALDRICARNSSFLSNI